MASPHQPQAATVVASIRETPDIVTLHLQLAEPHQPFDYQPGQFNMLYLYGVGEVAISIRSGPNPRTGPDTPIEHTIRSVGRVTRALTALQPGARLGLRGPYGRGWPLEEARGRDILVITGGLGCAPAVSAIEHLMLQRDQYGSLTLIQGVRHSHDLLWRERYEHWARQPDTRVLLAADLADDPQWRGHTGTVTELLDQLPTIRPSTLAMLCGPEPMMKAAAERLLQRGLAAEQIWLSMERNMHCALGHCGHCQLGPVFICREGPVLPYARIRALLRCRGL